MRDKNGNIYIRPCHLFCWIPFGREQTVFVLKYLVHRRECTTTLCRRLGRKIIWLYCCHINLFRALIGTVGVRRTAWKPLRGALLYPNLGLTSSKVVALSEILFQGILASHAFYPNFHLTLHLQFWNFTRTRDPTSSPITKEAPQRRGIRRPADVSAAHCVIPCRCWGETRVILVATSFSTNNVEARHLELIQCMVYILLECSIFFEFLLSDLENPLWHVEACIYG